MLAHRALIVLFVCLAGCDSAEEKCKKAQSAAQRAWQDYVGDLDDARRAAIARQAEAHTRLSGDIERRLGPAAQKAADARYNRSTSEAWVRAYESSFNAACTQDPECARLRRDNVEAKAVMEDLDERLGYANAAVQAASGLAQAANAAAKAVILHPENPAVKAAQALSLESYERCNGL